MVKKAKKKITKSPKAKGWGEAKPAKPAKRSTKKRKSRKLAGK